MSATILYIEDNDQNYYLVRYILESQGYQVTRAEDGKTGLEAALHGDYDLLLLDIDLPGMDGYEVARTLREHARLSSLPIVAVTSYALSGDHEKCLTAGCNRYIEKPINPGSFILEITSILEDGNKPEGQL
jgi:CheY-like chemotaxis protein